MAVHHGDRPKGGQLTSAVAIVPRDQHGDRTVAERVAPLLAQLLDDRERRKWHASDACKLELTTR